MNKITGFADGPYVMYVRTLLEARVASLRRHLRQRDMGASAIELAVITAIVGAVAVALALVIKTVVNNQSNKIKNLNGG
jgi:Flp pilus assembly pilin Flp